MALIECPECGKKLSDQAKTCPHCAYPIKKLTQKSDPEYRNHWIAVLGSILAISAGGYFFWCQAQEYQKAEDTRFQSECDYAASMGGQSSQYVLNLEKGSGRKCIFTP